MLNGKVCCNLFIMSAWVGKERDGQKYLLLAISIPGHCFISDTFIAPSLWNIFLTC